MNMKILDLKIETLRQPPSNSRTEGFAFLVRAGYMTRERELTLLGQQTILRLQKLAKADPGFLAQLGLAVIQTSIGETFSEISSGSVTVLQCPVCHYVDRAETARFKKHALPEESLLTVEKVSTPDCNTIESLANFLGIPREKTAKALMFTRLTDDKFIFVAIRGDMQLSDAKLKKLVGEIRLATMDEIAGSGAAPGYASPIGLKNALIVVDDLIPQSSNLAAGANEPGYHLKNTNYGRDYTAEVVADVVRAGRGDACPNCGNPLILSNAELLADDSGFYFDHLLVALGEAQHDDKGLTLPVSAAPFDVHLMQLPGREIDTKGKAEEIYSSLQSAGISVLFDDRPERAGVKFNDADLIGLPLRVTVGEKNLKEGMVELKSRKSKENQLVPAGEITQTIQTLLKTLK